MMNWLAAPLLLLCLPGPVDAAPGAEEGTCNNVDAPGCQASGATAAPHWPFKNGDLNRTGLSPHVAPFDLSKPSWVFEEPREAFKEHGWGVFHASPVIDAELNVYIPSTNGVLYSLTSLGRLRWSFKLSGRNPGNCALLDGVLFTATDDGMAHALDAATGRKVWSVTIGMACPDDTWSAVAWNGTVILPATPQDWAVAAHNAERRPTSGGDELVALRAADGRERWRYNHARRGGAASFNVIPAIVDGSVVFDDMAGGIFRLSLEDGREQWHAPAPNPDTWSTGASLVSPGGAVLSARNAWVDPWGGCGGDGGFVRAHDLATGRLLWDRRLGMSMNVGLAVGPLRPGGPPAVVAVPGNNDMLRPRLPAALAPLGEGAVWFLCLHCWFLLEPLSRLLNFAEGLMHAGERRSSIVALDAASGETIWSLDLAIESFAMPWPELRPASFYCAPDIAGNPAIGADGTVYVSWSGGKVFAIKDANGDGRIDAKDTRELSFFPHGFGSNGNSAIGPGFLAVPTCNGVIGFTA